MEKLLLLQVNITDKQKVNDLYTISNERCEQYAKEIGADYLLIKDKQDWTHLHPAWLKLKAYELTEYDQIMIVDSDIIIHENAPNIFDMFDIEDGIGVTFHEYGYKPQYINVDNYFSTGIILFSKQFLLKTKDWTFAYMKNNDIMNTKTFPAWEQDLLNLVVQEFKTYCVDITTEWNNAYSVFGNYADHFCGIKGKNAWERVRNAY